MIEVKWLLIFATVAYGAMFISLAYINHEKADCAKSFATSNRTADDIDKICKTK